MSKPLYSYMPKFDLTFFSGYIGYLVLGYYLSIKTFKFNNRQVTWALIYLFMVAIAGIGTNLLNQNASKLNTFFYNYLFITTALAAAGLFLWVKESMQNLKVPNWVLITDKYSFGIYLAHIIPLNYFHPLISKQLGTVWVIPLASICAIIASIIITVVLRKIPFGKYVSG